MNKSTFLSITSSALDCVIETIRSGVMSIVFRNQGSINAT